jgi:hypothetical protein
MESRRKKPVIVEDRRWLALYPALIICLRRW